MKSNLPPLPPDVSNLMDAERARPAPDAERLARVKNRLHASVAAGAVVDLPRNPSWSQALSWTRVVGTAGFMGLVVAGAWMVQPRTEKPVPVVEIAVPVKAPEPLVDVVVEVAPPPAEEELPVASPVPVPVVRKRAVPNRTRDVAVKEPPVPPPDVETAPVKAPAEELAEEHQLLERARMHLQGLRTQEARAALDEHGRRFPSGRLVEERHALEVVVMARSGDTEGAQRAADGFRAAHRRSLFQPMIDRALKH